MRIWVHPINSQINPPPYCLNGVTCMDIIFLNDLRVETVIGIFDWERSIRQTVSIDLQMGTDIRKASAADDINDTLDYKAVAKRLIEFVGGSEFGLVEALA